MAYYYNQAGYRGLLTERAMEPPDCWGEELSDLDEEEYDRTEDETSGRFNRSKATAHY